MSGSRPQISSRGQPFDEGGPSTDPTRSRQVKVLEDGRIQVTYGSYTEYLRSRGLYTADKDRFSELPMGILAQIVKYVIPNTGHIAIGIDYFDTNKSNIKLGSLSILSVSKLMLEAALPILYGHRRFEVSAITDRHRPAKVEGFNRWNILRNATDEAHPIFRPIDCLSLLIRCTPAPQYMTFLKFKINLPMVEYVQNGELVRAIRHATGLLVLELELQVDMRSILAFVYQLQHIRTINLTSRFREIEVHKQEMARRNKHWAQPLPRARNTRGMTPEPGWVVIQVNSRLPSF